MISSICQPDILVNAVLAQTVAPVRSEIMTGNEVSRATKGRNEIAFSDDRTVNSEAIGLEMSSSGDRLSVDVTLHSIETSLPAFSELQPASEMHWLFNLASS